MKLTLWTYEGPPHVGAMRVATGMKGLHYVLHAPQGDTYADLLFTMIERRDRRPPVTYTTFQARDLGADTANLFKDACRDAYARFQPAGDDRRRVLHRRTDPGRSGRSGRDDGPADPGDPAGPAVLQRKENFGADETFLQIVRRWPNRWPDGTGHVQPSGRDRAWLPPPRRRGRDHRGCWVDGHHRQRGAPRWAPPRRHRPHGGRAFQRAALPRNRRKRRALAGTTFGQPYTKVVPIGVGATRDFLAEVLRPDGAPALVDESRLRLPWWSASVDSTYLTGKRVFLFGDATHVMAAARIARDEIGFEVVGMGCYNREFARPMRALAKEFGVEALITDDYLEVEARSSRLRPN
jgi:light-independent protochlorophyllide reductase subunit B